MPLARSRPGRGGGTAISINFQRRAYPLSISQSPAHESDSKAGLPSRVPDNPQRARHDPSVFRTLISQCGYDPGHGCGRARHHEIIRPQQNFNRDPNKRARTGLFGVQHNVCLGEDYQQR